MASTALRTFAKDVPSYMKIRLQHVRHGHRLRGKPPTVALTLKERLELRRKAEEDPATSFQVNIGFAVPKIPFRRKQAWMAERKEKVVNNHIPEETESKDSGLNLNEAREIWLETSYASHICRIAKHYGVFRDLFGDAFFSPVVPMDIDYRVERETFVKVHTGNVLKPAEAADPPIVDYKAEKDSLWTLVMSTPDGHLENSSSEYCHWFLGNIPGNRTDEAERIVDYLRPFPAHGAGYYRYVFILYKQNRHLDYAEYKRDEPCLQLKDRNWDTLEFYRKHQDNLTPAGLAFFQSDWDSTVRELYHGRFNAKEPMFQYDFPKPYLKPQKWFPLKEPFNLYLDRYRDPRDVRKEFLLRRLKAVHPFEEPSPAPKYPNVDRIDNEVPSWLKEEMQKERLGWGRVNDLLK